MDPLNLVGSVIADKYRVDAFVSEGGFAVVYRAVHTIWNKPVALKLFSGLRQVPEADRYPLHQAFIAEGAFLSDLCSETASVVQPRDIGTLTTADGQWLPYLVLEWLEGDSLEDFLNRERAAGATGWTLAQAIALLAQVATALDVAHEKGIAHRDVKPSNLFLLGHPTRDDIGTVKILDFGVAKMMSAGSSSAPFWWTRSSSVNVPELFLTMRNLTLLLVMALALHVGCAYAGDWFVMSTTQRVAGLAVLVSGGAAVYFLACYLVGLRVGELRMKPPA